MAIGNVVVYFGKTRLLKGTDISYDGKFDNTTDDTFDGKELSQGPPTYTVKVSGIYSYNAKFENQLKQALDLTNSEGGLPLTVVDGNLTIQCTGCVIDSNSYKRSPKSKATRDFGFTAKTLVEKWK